MSAQVAALRELLERRFPDATPVRRGAGALATGVGELDAILPLGGLPRGGLVTWTPGVGSAAVLRWACRSVAAGGERSAWVDGARVVSGDGWLSEAVLLRPEGSAEALEWTEELGRSGGFALVVLTGARAREAERVRLSRAVREGGGSIVVMDGGGFMGGVRVATRVGPESWGWRLDPFGDVAALESVRVRARVSAPGWMKEADFTLRVMDDELRMSVERGLVDRRGATR